MVEAWRTKLSDWAMGVLATLAVTGVYTIVQLQERVASIEARKVDPLVVSQIQEKLVTIDKRLEMSEEKQQLLEGFVRRMLEPILIKAAGGVADEVLNQRPSGSEPDPAPLPDE